MEHRHHQDQQHGCYSQSSDCNGAAYSYAAPAAEGETAAAPTASVSTLYMRSVAADDGSNLIGNNCFNQQDGIVGMTATTTKTTTTATTKTTTTSYRHDEVAGDDFAHRPKFTAEDDQRDVRSLTIADLVRLQSDLTGIEMAVTTAGVSGMALGASSSACAATASATSGGSAKHSQDTALLLASLDMEMAKLPAESTSSYYQAVRKCPREVSPERRLAFLECENNDAARAAQRLAGYWEFRLVFFGRDKCYLPMILAGTMAEELVNLATRKVYQLLPCTDAAGRGIIYMRISNRDFAQYTIEEEFKAFYYLTEILTLNESIRRRGFVVLVDDQDSSRKNYSIRFQRYSRIMDHTFPIRLRAYHLCHPSKTMFYIIYPACKHFLPKHVRVRGALHHGSTAAVLRSLSTYSLTPDCLPTELGGNVVLDAYQFLYDRMATEAAMYGVPFPATALDQQKFGLGPGPTSGAWAADDAGGAMSSVYASGHPSSSLQAVTAFTAAAATAGTSTGTATGYVEQQADSVQNIGSAKIIANSSAMAADFSSSSAAAVPPATKRGSDGDSEKKSSRRRRQRSSSTKKESMVDPRMAKAVKAKQDNPEMKLFDALVHGGYVFHEKAGSKDLINQDGTGLRQCKNNLCRRLRIEREKKKKAGQGNSSEHSDPARNDCETVGLEYDEKDEEDQRTEPVQVPEYQYDSFDEEIFKLPGWDDVGDGTAKNRPV